MLVSRRDQYVSLHNVLWDASQYHSSSSRTGNSNEDESPSVPRPINISERLAIYKVVDPLTEIVMAPTSLVHTPSGTHFYAGGQNRISFFDLSYTNEPPLSQILTIPSKRSKLKGGGYGFKGTISALDISPPSTMARTGALAAGSRTRYVGLYDSERSGEEITHFVLAGGITGSRDSTSEENKGLNGTGVSHLKWSTCGTYLYVAERMSDVLLIYDVRKFERALGYCAGRKAITNKKMCFDIWKAQDLYSEGVTEVWAGGTDGCVRVWRDPHLKEGAVEAEEVVKVCNEPVASALVHPYGGLAIVASGGRELYGEIGERKGERRGGGHAPAFREWGSLKILELGNDEDEQNMDGH